MLVDHSGREEGGVSYDLQVWSTRSIDRPAALPDAARWGSNDGGCTWSGRGWQIVVGPQHRVEFEDVPEEVHDSGEND